MLTSFTNTTNTIDLPARGILVCRPADWTDISLFLLLNYIAHAFTTLTSPWHSVSTFLLNVYIVLFMPTVALATAIRRVMAGFTMHWHEHNPPSAEKTEMWRRTKAIRKAHYAEALGTLAIGKRVQGQWGDWEVQPIAPLALVRALEIDPNPLVRDQMRGSGYSSKHAKGISRMFSLAFPTLQKVHGAIDIDSHLRFDAGQGVEDYIVTLVRLPTAGKVSGPGSITFTMDDNDSRVGDDGQSQTRARGKDNDLPHAQIAEQGTFMKSAVAILQSMFGFYTLWNARDRELEVYGYASFSFTILPYSMMSFINFIALMCMPQYDAVFLVKYDLGSGEEEGWDQGDRASVERLNQLMTSAVGRFRLGSCKEGVEVGGEAGHLQPMAAMTSDQAEAPENTAPSTIVPENTPAPKKLPYSRKSAFINAFLTMTFHLLPFVINVFLTHLHGNQSTTIQRVFILGWLLSPAVGHMLTAIFAGSMALMGIVASPETPVMWKMKPMFAIFGKLLPFSPELEDGEQDQGPYGGSAMYGGLMTPEALLQQQLDLLCSRKFWLFLLGQYLSNFGMNVSSVFAIGGYVMVVKMINDFGICRVV